MGKWREEYGDKGKRLGRREMKKRDEEKEDDVDGIQ